MPHDAMAPMAPMAQIPFDRRKTDASTLQLLDVVDELKNQVKRAGAAHWLLAFAAVISAALALSLGILAWEAFERSRVTEANRVLICYQMFVEQMPVHATCADLSFEVSNDGNRASTAPKK